MRYLLICLTLCFAVAYGDIEKPEAKVTEAEQLRARIQELATIVTEKDKEIKKLRRRNAELGLEIGRLERLCKKAGIDLKQKAETKEMKVPEEVQAFFNKMARK